MAGNRLSEFYSNVPGSNYKLKDIDSIIDGKGELKEIYDIDVIVNSINKILRIQKGTYLDDPDFGVGLEKYLFEPADRQTIDAITHEVKQAIANYERRAKIQIDIRFTNNTKGFEINIKVEKNGLTRVTSVNISSGHIKDI